MNRNINELTLEQRKALVDMVCGKPKSDKIWQAYLKSQKNQKIRMMP